MAAEPEAGRVVLTMSLVGAPRLFLGGAPIRVPNRKLLAALGVLALSETGRETRERLVGLLWSELDEALARGSLRQAMAGFRRICGDLGFEGLEADREAIAFLPGSIATDVAEIEAATGDGRVHPALIDTTDLPGRLMLTCDELDPSMRAWLYATRERWRARLLRRLSADLDATPPGGPGEEETAQAVLRLDPAREPAARRLMAARARAGDPAGAIRVYDALWSVLEEEHDLEPSEETAALAVAIKSGAGPEPAPPEPPPPAPAAAPDPPPAPAPAPAAPPAVLAPGEAPLLRVEPFAAIDLAPDGRERAEAFRHALLAGLARFREWRVADGAEGGAGEEAPAFRLRAQVEGPRLSAVLTLVEGAGAVLRADRFDLDAAEAGPARDRLLRHLEAAITLHMARRHAETGGDGDAPALWLRARAALARWTPEGRAEAEAPLAAALAAAPDWAAPLAGRAMARVFAGAALPGRFRTTEDVAAALADAERAATLDPLDPTARLALAWGAAAAGRWDAADAAATEAEALNPDDAPLLTALALLRAAEGRGEAALALAAEAAETAAPDAAGWAHHAALRFLAGDEAGAEEAARLAEGGPPLAGLWRVAALARRGEPDDAAEALAALDARLAAAWEGDAAFSAPEAARWALQALPLREPAAWRRLRDGLALAGAQVEGARFEAPTP